MTGYQEMKSSYLRECQQHFRVMTKITENQVPCYSTERLSNLGHKVLLQITNFRVLATFQLSN